MNCIIVDDEPLARKGMALNVAEIKTLNLLGEFSSATQATEFLLHNQVDLLFLDIEMPGLSGLEFLKTLTTKPIVILTTAYPQYALEAFELDVLDYLVKPIRFDRFCKAVNKANEIHTLKSQPSIELSIDEKDDFMFIRSERKIVKLFFSDVRYIKGMKDYVIIYTKDTKYMTAMNVKTIHSQLPDEIFARVSKSYIINVNLVNSIELDIINLGDEEIPLGNSYKQAFLSTYVDSKIVDRKK